MKRKLKIKTEVGVSDICVPIQSEQEAREADFILRSSGEKFDARFPWGPTQPYLLFHEKVGDWFYNQSPDSRVEITIPQLTELLGVEYPLKQLPTLEELIAEAKSKITVKSESYPCWVDGSKEVTTYMCAGLEYYSERAAIASYISKKIREEYL